MIEKLFSSLMAAMLVLFVSVGFFACSDDDGDNQQVDGDSGNVDGDLQEDGDADTSVDGDSDQVDGDSESEQDSVEVVASCSEDGRYLEKEIDGEVEKTDCWAKLAGYCVDGACVSNWRVNADDDSYSACLDDPHAAAHSLAEKAAHMDKLMENLHVHPQHGLVTPVLLRSDYYEDWAADNGKTVEDMTEDDYLAAEEAAGFDDAEAMYTGENDGLFSSIYVASQAFRYAVTKDEQALANIKRALGGTYREMQVTGVPGIYTRNYVTPGVSGMSCPENPCQYWPDIDRDEFDKDDNRWVMVKDGCIHHYGGENGSYTDDQTCEGEWVKEDVCGLEEFNGYCWVDNVSKDEYSGHMMAAAVVGKLVDDEEVQTIVKDIYSQVAGHLIDNDLAFVDHDGLVAEHGEMWSYTNDGYPGFHATLVLSWILAAAEATGDADFWSFYNDCLLKKSGPLDCSDRMLEDSKKPYVEQMEEALILYVGKDACTSNWNNFSMTFISVLPLIWYEADPEMRARYQGVLENHMIREDNNFRDVIRQKNAMYNFIYASMRDNSQGMDYDAINDAICQLRQFPISKADPDRTNIQEDRPENPECSGRNGGYLADTPQEIWQRCPQTNVWWNNPYRWDNCARNPLKIHPGSDYLFTYWMGRYFGFVGEDF